MQALQHASSIGVEEYLAGELKSQVRHEYLGGQVYAMAGTSSEHNIICQNFTIALRSALRGKRCQVFTENLKLGLRARGEDLFYYPDVIVTCHEREDRYIKRFPTLLIEVLSPDTERIDRREKFSNYTQIETLEDYVLAAQDAMEVTAFRRANDWRSEIVKRPEDALRIPSLDFTMSLAAIYEGCEGLSA